MLTLTRRAVLGALAAAPATALRRRDTDAETFGAWLAGASEVPPVETDAGGLAVFRVAAGGATVDYWLAVAGIENVAQAHVHKGPPDLNGNVVAYLYGPADRPVSGTGLLAAGALTDDDVIWPLSDVAGLVDQLRAENAYVNVHTTEHPEGEIRGQIRPVGDLADAVGVSGDLVDADRRPLADANRRPRDDVADADIDALDT